MPNSHITDGSFYRFDIRILFDVLSWWWLIMFVNSVILYLYAVGTRTLLRKSCWVLVGFQPPAMWNSAYSYVSYQFPGEIRIHPLHPRLNLFPPMPRALRNRLQQIKTTLARAFIKDLKSIESHHSNPTVSSLAQSELSCFVDSSVTHKSTVFQPVCLMNAHLA